MKKLLITVAAVAAIATAPAAQAGGLGSIVPAFIPIPVPIPSPTVPCPSTGAVVIQTPIGTGSVVVNCG